MYGFYEHMHPRTHTIRIHRNLLINKAPMARNNRLIVHLLEQTLVGKLIVGGNIIAAFSIPTPKLIMLHVFFCPPNQPNPKVANENANHFTIPL